MLMSDLFGQRMPVIAGPCVVESEALCLQVAEALAAIGERHRMPVVFKASYRKANRTAITSFTGIGDEQALKVLQEVRQNTGLPVLTDVHEISEIATVAEVADIIQIPAFLCRQTDLLLAAAATGKVVNIKKGQFASADIMKHAVEKLRSVPGAQVMLTERGTFFGYEDLVVDMRNISLMKEAGVPVIYDVTHSVQQPGKAGGKSGGQPRLAEPLAAAALAAGADGIFVETHPNPAEALSDAATMMPLRELEGFILRMLQWRELYQTQQKR